MDFEVVETAARRLALEAMGKAVSARLNADRSDEGERRCGCAGAAVYVECREKTFTTALGSMTLERAWYHCPACGHGFSPRDRALGLENASLSPAVRRMVGIAAGEMSFGHASAALRELAGLDVGAKQVERHAEALGRDIARDELEVVDPEPATGKTLYVGLDGTGVPMRKSETAGRVGKQADGSARHVKFDYFTANRERMAYPTFRANGLCVSTGVVEGACKSVIGNRLKRGGMHWTVDGANAIIALRCAIVSNRFDDDWERQASPT